MRTGSLVETQTYTYDANDRLTGVCFQSGTCPGAQDPFIRWTYDELGNRLTETRPAGTTTYAYNAADQLLSAGSTSYTYDDNGNQTGNGSDTFTYDLANHLKTHASGATTTTYTYDGDGVRTQAATGSQPADVTKALWDTNHDLPQIALERDGADALLRRYLYGARRLSMTTPAGTSYYLYDGLGSVVNLTSASGDTQWTYGYEPFGAPRTETPTGSPAANSMKFTGEYLDPTGLYHLRARQYEPTSGRLLRLDPHPPDLYQPSSSPYPYANAQPTVYVDPSGLTIVPSLQGITAAALVTTPNLRKPPTVHPSPWVPFFIRIFDSGMRTRIFSIFAQGQNAPFAGGFVTYPTSFRVRFKGAVIGFKRQAVTVNRWELMYGLQWDTRQLDRNHYLNVTFLYATSSDPLGYRSVAREIFCPAREGQDCAFRLPINPGRTGVVKHGRNVYTTHLASDRWVSRVISTFAVLPKRGGGFPGLRKRKTSAEITCRIFYGGCIRP